MKKLLFLILLVQISNNSLSAQQKFEKESKIKLGLVPDSAVEFVCQFDFNKRIKWYKEEGLNSFSYEAKTKYKGNHYSFEFDTTGIIEDIEVEVNWQDVPVSIQESIIRYFETHHSKFKIDKIQKQYSGDEADLLNLFADKRGEEKYTIKYEILIKTKVDKAHQLIEYLFNDQGKMEQKSIVIVKNADQLEY